MAETEANSYKAEAKISLILMQPNFTFDRIFSKKTRNFRSIFDGTSVCQTVERTNLTQGYRTTSAKIRSSGCVD